MGFIYDKYVKGIVMQFLENKNTFDLFDIEAELNNFESAQEDNKSNDKVYNCVFGYIINTFGDLKQMNDSELKSAVNLSVNEAVQKINTEINDWISQSCNRELTMQDICELSNMNYESATCGGKIILIKDNCDLTYEIRFSEDEYKIPFQFSGKDLKFVRKLLEAADDSLALVLKSHEDSEGKKIWLPMGFCSVPKNQSYPTISIKGKLCWEFYASKKKVIFSKGKYLICKDDESVRKELEDFNKVNDSISISALKKLIEIIRTSKDIHGALLIFLDDLQKEKVDSLCLHKYGIKVDNANNKQITLTDSDDNIRIISRLCKIDGALVFDKNGTLLSISTILDGCVVNDGDIGRGSRYNSTRTFVDYYVNYNNHTGLKCYGLVISEDGYVNFVKPNDRYNDRAFDSII